MAWNYFFRTTSIQYINLVLKAARSVSTVCKYCEYKHKAWYNIVRIFYGSTFCFLFHDQPINVCVCVYCVLWTASLFIIMTGSIFITNYKCLHLYNKYNISLLFSTEYSPF